MIKRITSLILCLIITAGVFAMPVSSYAKSYRQKLLDSGFPETYVDSLVSLHSKYPNWTFKPFKTELDWQTAVDGERSPASKQVVSSGSSASEATVKYYMDPRNWLNEKYIFQFESIKYDDDQTKKGVEAIISSTWMKDSYITYNTTQSKTKTYKDSSGNKVKYSTAFMNAAKDSKMSAYFLASKVVQEVGGATPKAGGVCGTREPFIGMYNYYSIGAYTNASDGLHWANGLLKTAKKTKLYADYDAEKKKGTGKTTSLSSEQCMSYITSKGDYYLVKLYSVNSHKYSTDGTVGYVLKDDCTRYTSYGRPWTNPYKSIYNGAQFIADGYLKYQYTGYLMKFNVNKNSPSLHYHEYMTNVNGAVNEAAITYRAYSSASLMNDAKTFYIPVFKNMPKEKCSPSDSSSGSTQTYNPVEGLTLKSRTKETLSFKWDKFEGASKYYLYIENLTKGTHFDKTVTTNSAELKGLTPANKYSVKVKAYSSKGWSDYSLENVKHTIPDKAEGFKLKSIADTSAVFEWKTMEGADGYKIYSYNETKKKYTLLKTVDGGGVSSTKVSSLKSAHDYTFAICAFTVDSKTKCGAKSDKISKTTKLKKVKLKSLTSPSKTKIKAKWSEASGGETGYEIIYSRDKKFKKVVAKKLITSKKTVSYTGKNFTKGVKYYVKVRSYKTTDKKNKYGKWSNVKSVKSK